MSLPCWGCPTVSRPSETGDSCKFGVPHCCSVGYRVRPPCAWGREWGPHPGLAPSSVGGGALPMPGSGTGWAHGSGNLPCCWSHEQGRDGTALVLREAFQEAASTLGWWKECPASLQGLGQACQGVPAGTDAGRGMSLPMGFECSLVHCGLRWRLCPFSLPVAGGYPWYLCQGSAAL